MEMRLTTTCTELRKAVRGVDTKPSMLSVWRPPLGSSLPATTCIYYIRCTHVSKILGILGHESFAPCGVKHMTRSKFMVHVHAVAFGATTNF